MQKLLWDIFIWDEDNTDRLSEQQISVYEAEEVFMDAYIVTANKQQCDQPRYRVDGKTGSGRKIRLIVEDRGGQVAYIIAGEDL